MPGISYTLLVYRARLGIALILEWKEIWIRGRNETRFGRPDDHDSKRSGANRWKQAITDNLLEDPNSQDMASFANTWVPFSLRSQQAS